MDSGPQEIVTLDEGWDRLYSEGIVQLQNMLEQGLENTNKLFNNQEYSDIYTLAYLMCTQRSPFNWSEPLYQRHGESIQSYLRDNVLPPLRSKYQEHLLIEVVRRWEDHKILNKWMQKFFMYLDRFYVKYNSVPKLSDAGLAHFKSLVFDDVKTLILDAVIDLLNMDRDGIDVDRGLVRKVTDLYQAMGRGDADVYEEEFEIPFLNHSREYYKSLSAEWVEGDSAPDYLMRVEGILRGEEERADMCLKPSSKQKLLGVVVEELLECHQPKLIDNEASGCAVLFINDCRDDLRRMGSLFGLIREGEGLEPLAESLKHHILILGEGVVEERIGRLSNEDKPSSSDPIFIRGLLGLHDEIGGMIGDVFGGRGVFQKALKDAFGDLANRDIGPQKTSELVAAFCDRVLRSGGEKLSDDEAEMELERIVQLFSYLVEKDFFSEVYRIQLSKRLLNQQSLSDDLEKLMIGKLKLKCGAQYTGKLEGMLNDLSLALDTQSTFEQFIQSYDPSLVEDRDQELERENVQEGKESAISHHAPHVPTEDYQALWGDMEVKVKVLTGGYWPSYPTVDIHLPFEMNSAIQAFQQFFASPDNHKQLTWKFTLGTAVVKMSLGGGSFYLQLSTPQCVVLMLCFNHLSNDEWIDFEQVTERTNLPQDMIKRVVHSFLKSKILRRRDGGAGSSGSSGSGSGSSSSGGQGGKGIKTSDQFSINSSFSSSKRRINIPMAALDDSASSTGKRVEEDRSIAIEACVVRVMKIRKSIGHQQLIAEVLSQLSFFKPHPKVIKRRIEALIDREYIERSRDDTNVYNYLA